MRILVLFFLFSLYGYSHSYAEWELRYKQNETILVNSEKTYKIQHLSWEPIGSRCKVTTHTNKVKGEELLAFVQNLEAEENVCLLEIKLVVPQKIIYSENRVFTLEEEDEGKIFIIQYNQNVENGRYKFVTRYSKYVEGKDLKSEVKSLSEDTNICIVNIRQK